MALNCAAYQRRGTEGIVSLPGVMDIFEAEKLYAAALEALEDRDCSKVKLDLTETQHLDVSALQILCALRGGVEAAGRGFSVGEPGDELIDSAARLGIPLFAVSL